MAGRRSVFFLGCGPGGEQVDECLSGGLSRCRDIFGAREAPPCRSTYQRESIKDRDCVARSEVGVTCVVKETKPPARETLTRGRGSFHATSGLRFRTVRCSVAFRDKVRKRGSLNFYAGSDLLWSLI